MSFHSSQQHWLLTDSLEIIISFFFDLISCLHQVPAAVEHYGWQGAPALAGFMLDSKLVHHRNWTDFMLAHILN